MDWLADRVDSLAKQASEITLYDVKSVVNKAKAYALNLTEYEQKVREATNDDPWGASSTLMQDIARATFDFQLFNEIMPTIYSRFMEKEARQWRQIYKSLVLLEYLVKNGSERVIDDSRSHLSLIKVLRNFHYIDENGKDQGINVRNRAKELGELLSDLDRVRQERRKAKQNRNKYTGVGNDGSGGGGPSFTSASGSRYGGFGSDSFNNSDSYAGSSSGGAGGFSDSRNAGNQDFEAYDAGDDEDHGTTPSASASYPRTSATSSRTKPTPTTPNLSTPAAAAPVAKQPEVNLFDFDDDDEQALGGGTLNTFTTSPPPPPKPTANLFASNSQAVSAAVALDDDFDDFQSAVPFATNTAAAPQVSRPLQPDTSSSSQNVFSMLNQPPQPPLPNININSNSMSPRPVTTPTQARPSQGSMPGSQPSNPKTTTSSGGDFSDLFSFGPSSTTVSSPSSSTTAGAGGQKLSLAQIAAEKRQQSLFSAPSATNKAGVNSGFGGGAGGGDGWDSLI